MRGETRVRLSADPDLLGLRLVYSKTCWETSDTAFSILSVSVAATSSTHFSSATGAAGASVATAAFFSGRIGPNAAARGSWDGMTLMADRASLRENEDD